MPQRYASEGWILLPDVQGQTDCAAVSDKVERYTGTEGCAREVCEDLGTTV